MMKPHPPKSSGSATRHTDSTIEGSASRRKRGEKCGARPEPFPVDLLPSVVRDYVVEGAESCYAVPSIVALPVLATLAACIGTTRRIAPKRAWTAPAIIWGAVVARSGSVKSSGYDFAMALLSEDEDKHFREHKEANELFKVAEAEHRKAFNTWSRSKQGDAPPPDAPKEPIGHRFVVDDQTLESLVPLMEENPRGLYQLTDELRGFFEGMGAYSASGSGGKDEARWLAVFDGRPFNVDRKQDRERYYIRQTAVSVAGTIQPGVLAGVFSPNRVTSGMLARLLMVMPEPRAKQWTEQELSETTRLAMQRVVNRLKELDHEIVDDVPKPVILSLTDEARNRFIHFVNAHGVETMAQDDALAAAWSKLEGYALRFALVDHLTRWAAGNPNCHADGPVGIESIEAGIELSRWFANEAERVYGCIGVTADQSEAEKDRHVDRLAEWLASRGGSATEREIGRGPRRYRGAENEHHIVADCIALMGVGRAKWDVSRKTRRIVLVDPGDSGDGDTSIKSKSETSEVSPNGAASVATGPATTAGANGDTFGNSTVENTQVSPSPVSPPVNDTERVRITL
ncbi:MAG: YfjI family protein [Rubripirellula sp.]